MRRGNRVGRRLLPVLALCALTATPAAAQTPPPITVNGSQLTAGGGPIQLRGVNDAAYGLCAAKVADGGSINDYADGPVDQRAIDAMTSWGINVVRVLVDESCWLGLPTHPADASQIPQPADGQTASEYQQAVESFVNRLGASGLYVILDLNSTAPPGYTSGSGVDTLPDEAAAPLFWQEATRAFGADRFVMFDLINEVALSSYTPGFTEDELWNCWLDGCPDVPSIQDDVSFTAAGMQQLVDTVRQTPDRANPSGDKTTPLIIGSPYYDFDKSEWSTHVPDDPARKLIVDVHLYDTFFGVNSTNETDPTAEASAVAGADSYISATLVPLAGQYPVMVGELGQLDCDDTATNTAPFVAGVLSDLDSVQASDDVTLSVLGWSWLADADNGVPLKTDWGCPPETTAGPVLIRDYNGTPTVMGQTFKSWFQSHATPPDHNLRPLAPNPTSVRFGASATAARRSRSRLLQHRH